MNLSSENMATLEAAYNIKPAAKATLKKRRKAIAVHLGVQAPM